MSTRRSGAWAVLEGVDAGLDHGHAHLVHAVRRHAHEMGERARRLARDQLHVGCHGQDESDLPHGTRSVIGRLAPGSERQEELQQHDHERGMRSDSSSQRKLATVAPASTRSSGIRRPMASRTADWSMGPPPGVQKRQPPCQTPTRDGITPQLFQTKDFLGSPESRRRFGPEDMRQIVRRGPGWRGSAAREGTGWALEQFGTFCPVEANCPPAFRNPCVAGSSGRGRGASPPRSCCRRPGGAPAGCAGARPTRGRAPRAAGGRQGRRTQQRAQERGVDRAVGQADGALDQVLQLAHVARVVVVEQQRERVLRELGRRDPLPAAELLDEVADEVGMSSRRSRSGGSSTSTPRTR